MISPVRRFGLLCFYAFLAFAGQAQAAEPVTKTIKFTFPSKVSLGWFYQLQTKYPPRLIIERAKFLAKAQGTVVLHVVPGRLALAGNNHAISDNTWLSGIPANSIDYLCFAYTKLDDSWLKNLSKLPWLTKLDLKKTRVTDAGIANVSSLPNLEQLNIEDNEIDGSCFSKLVACKRLVYLSANGSLVTAKNVRMLRDLPTLESLSLKQTATDDVTVEDLSPLKKLKYLCLDDCKITDRALTTIASFRELETLEIGYTGTTVSGLKKLSQCKQLRSLNVDGCIVRGIESGGLPKTLKAFSAYESQGINDAFVRRKEIGSLSFLNVGRTRVTAAGVSTIAKNTKFHSITLTALGLDDKAIQPLANLKLLRTLVLDGNPIGSRALTFISKLPHLENLSLTRTIVDDAAIPILAQCKSLRFLSLSYTRITKQGVEGLRKRLPACRVEHNIY